MFKKNHKPWNEGLKLTEDHCQKLSDSHTKQIPWNKGMKLSPTMKKKMNFSGLQKGRYKGKKFSLQTREKMRNSAKKGSANFHWKGGKFIDRGYVFVYKPEHPYSKRNYIAEHRLVVETQIGRYLTSKEEVHHLGAKDDNRPEMLMGFSSHSAHRRFENNKKIKMIEIIFDGRRLKDMGVDSVGIRKE